MVGALEIFENVSPAAFVIGCTAMAFVNDDQIEKIFGQMLVKNFAIKRCHHRLENTEIDAAAFWQTFFANSFRRNAAHCVFFKLPKIVERLVRKNIAVGKEKDSRQTVLTIDIPAGIEKFPADLECDVGFSGSCCERKQHTVLLAGDGIHHIVDSNFLIVTRLFATVPVEWNCIQFVAKRIAYRI